MIRQEIIEDNIENISKKSPQTEKYTEHVYIYTHLNGYIVYAHSSL